MSFIFFYILLSHFVIILVLVLLCPFFFFLLNVRLLHIICLTLLSPSPSFCPYSCACSFMSFSLLFSLSFFYFFPRFLHISPFLPHLILFLFFSFFPFPLPPPSSHSRLFALICSLSCSFPSSMYRGIISVQERGGRYHETAKGSGETGLVRRWFGPSSKQVEGH